MNPLPGMEPFYSRFPDLAIRETRTLMLPFAQGGVPAGSYGLIECFCNEPHCDCRRALLQVWEQNQPGKVLATINFGWESLEFYTKWMHDDVQSAREIAEASLDPLNPQSEHADALLNLFREVVVPDTAYVARLARHYELFKRNQVAPPAPGAREALRRARRHWRR